MRTEMSREIGGVRLDAAVTAGAIMHISDRFGDLQAIARIIDRPNVGDVMRILTILVAAGSKDLGLSDAEQRVHQAFEEAGSQQIRDFLAALMAHAHSKNAEALGKPAPDQ